MNTSEPAQARILVIGAGPAGLMAAEQLAGMGHSVRVHEKMPSVARKFLMAGRGGLNLTHTQPRPGFDARYGEAAETVGGWLDGFDAAALIGWAEGLGQDTFVGSSRRVFPRAMKASPLLRAWLARLEQMGVEIVTRSEWTGRRGAKWLFRSADGETAETADAVILAMGGASWPRLGSSGDWTGQLTDEGIRIVPLRPANAGFAVGWSDVVKARFAGVPLKNIALTHKGSTVRGEAMICAYGLEGGAIYALSTQLRRSLEAEGHADVVVDLRPDLDPARLRARLARPRGKGSLSNHLRKTLGLDAASLALLREAGAVADDPAELARRIKAVPLRLEAMQGLERAISSAGGIALDQMDERLMLTALPGVFACGEMLDWEAPTGGYLLQACFASGVRVAAGVDEWLSLSKGPADP